MGVLLYMFPADSSSSLSYSLHSNRRKLLGRPAEPPAYSSPPEGRHGFAIPFAGESNFDSNILIILGALLCALMCALGLNSMVRCALRCSRRMVYESPEEVSVRLSNTGMRRRALRALPTVIYGSASELPEIGTDCAICLGDFAEGEWVRVLPKCNHSFHAKCIDIWLLSHSSCPTCRHCLLEAPESKQAGDIDNASANGSDRNNGGRGDDHRAQAGESCVGLETLIIVQADDAHAGFSALADAAALEAGIDGWEPRL